MDNDFMSFVAAKSRVYTLPCHGKGACITHEAMSHAMQGHTRRMGHSREF